MKPHISNAQIDFKKPASLAGFCALACFILKLLP
jgi:hypothetical protein